MKPRTLDPSLDSRPVRIVMVGAAHGLDTTSYAVPYVTSWASSVAGKSLAEVVQSTAERVRNTAIAILDQLDTAQVGDEDPPGLGKEALAHSGRRNGQNAARDAVSPIPTAAAPVRINGPAVAL